LPLNIANGQETVQDILYFNPEGRNCEMELEKLKKVIAEVLNVDPEEITPETTFVDDLGADSLDVFQIVMGIEEEFDIEIPAEKAEKITTVEEAVELIKGALN
jgi:acyl carrier protein